MAAPVAMPFLFLLSPAAALMAQRAPMGSMYFWPEPRGHPGSFSSSPFKAPRNLTRANLAWSWSNGGPRLKYSRAPHSGLVLDNNKSIYLSSTDGIRKFSHNGTQLWFAAMKTWRIPTLKDGKLFITNNDGRAVALSMETGKHLWSTKYTKALGTDVSGVAICGEVLLAASRGNPRGGAAAVAGLDPINGTKLWEFNAHSQLYNFMPMCTGNQSFIFQDPTGGVYHVDTTDGQLLWEAGYGNRTKNMAYGLAMVADGVVYAVESASLHAYDLATGTEIWKQDFPYPANSQPAVGHLGRGDRLSEHLALVMPIGSRPNSKADAFKTEIQALNAKTGKLLWKWTPPTWYQPMVAGDFKRSIHGTICLPTPYGSPSIDARGTVYLGHMNGMVYAIRDDNGDDIIQDSEVSKFDTGAGFSHGGAVIAPGMLAIPSCDGLYVFEE